MSASDLYPAPEPPDIGLIGFIAVQTLIGRVCPLTQLEQALREGAPWGSQTAVQRWLDPLLFCNAPGWVLPRYTNIGRIFSE